MKIAIINMVDYGSTGRIMFQTADVARQKGYCVKTYSKKWRNQNNKTTEHKYYGYTIENAIHVTLSKLFGIQGMLSILGTKQLIRDLKKYKPDIVHLHNLHDSSTCLPMLLKALGKAEIPVVWTLHDCWAFTGQCTHFLVEKCEKWKNGCGNCKFQKNLLKVDCTAWVWRKKKKGVDSIKNLTIVTPSKWLCGLAEESLFRGRPIKVINNGIDLTVFSNKSCLFKQERECGRKKIILAVASVWTERKGLLDLIEIDKKLDHTKYQLVVVGTNEIVDKLLPKTIISIHRTADEIELAKLYSCADVFINPTYEDTFPTTNIEALACGTPVITYNTGGSPEIIDNKCGYVVECGNIDAIIYNIIKICSSSQNYNNICRKRAECYDRKERYVEYVNLYEKVVEKYNKGR